TGSYNTVFILTVALLLIGVVLTLITKKYIAVVLAKIH
ncbi:MFS transporter, partial [Klebsiella oxytoca]|nr:MFS transporter [Klebsiella oxytoca]